MATRKRTIKKNFDETDEPIAKAKTVRTVKQVGTGTPSFKINCKFKNKKQKEMYDTIMNNRITFIRGAAGTGKAQPLYCKILTPDGWKLMGDVKVGDEIVTPENKISYINGVFPQGIKDIYKIIFSDDTYTFSCDEHLWMVKDEKLRNKRLRKDNRFYKAETNFKVVTLAEIIPDVNTRGRLNFNIPIVNEIEFEKKNTKITPYLMGLLLGDGSFRNSISFTSNDIEIQNYIQNEVANFNCKLSNFSQKNDTKYFNITGYKKVNNILDAIKEYELYNTNSDTKFIPSDYINSTIQDRKDILAGLLDTDGYIDKRNGVTYFYTVSEKLKDNVIEIVNSLGGTVKVTSRIGKYRYKGEMKEGKKCYNLCLSLNFNPFKLKRKFDLYQIKTKYKPVRYIKHVEYIGKEEAQCISVEDSQHLYITDNYIVTHNTFVSLMTALECIKDNKINIDQIVLTKPIVEITSNKNGLGALPGDLNEKTLSYYMHFYDNLTKLIGNDSTKLLKERGIIKDTVLNYLRGSTFGKWDENGKPVGSFCIFDEAQNCTPIEMKTFISRMGEESKLVIMGDSDQIDLKLNKGEKCGLDDAWDKLQGIEGIGYIEFSEEDIVRDPFLIEIMKRYKQQYSKPTKIINVSKDTPYNDDSIEFQKHEVKTKLEFGNHDVTLELGNEFKDKTSLAVLSPVIEDDFAYVHFINSMLSLGLKSPLYQEVREKKGLVYYIHSYLSRSNNKGVNIMATLTSNKNVDEVLEAIKLVVTNPDKFLTQERFDIIKDYYDVRKKKDEINLYKNIGQYLSPQGWSVYDILDGLTFDKIKEVYAKYFDFDKFYVSTDKTEFVEELV